MKQGYHLSHWPNFRSPLYLGHAVTLDGRFSIPPHRFTIFLRNANESTLISSSKHVLIIVVTFLGKFAKPYGLSIENKM